MKEAQVPNKPTIDHIVTYPNDPREDYKVWVTPEGWISESWIENGIRGHSTDTSPPITPEQIAADVKIREIENRQRIEAIRADAIESDLKAARDALEAEWQSAHRERARFYR